MVAGRPHLGRHRLQERPAGLAGGYAPGREAGPDVAEPRGPQQSVNHRVQEDVAVRVAGQAPVERDKDPADPERTTLHERMKVKSLPDPHPYPRLGGAPPSAVPATASPPAR